MEYLPVPVLHHQVLHLTESPILGDLLQTIHCDGCHPNTAMLAMLAL